MVPPVAGKSAWGIELSDAVLKSECPDLLKKKVSSFAAERAGCCKADWSEPSSDSIQSAFNGNLFPPMLNARNNTQVVRHATQPGIGHCATSGVDERQLSSLPSQVVEAGVLTNLPYANNTFDLVFSADVLEHIHEDEAEAVVGELVRVSRRHLFLSISLKPHTKVHCVKLLMVRRAFCPSEGAIVDVVCMLAHVSICNFRLRLGTYQAAAVGPTCNQIHQIPSQTSDARQVSAEDAKEANRHTMLRSRKWWDAKFAAHGAEVNHEMLWAMQYKNHRCHPSHFRHRKYARIVTALQWA